jgi:hypothetical protein
MKTFQRGDWVTLVPFEEWIGYLRGTSADGNLIGGLGPESFREDYNTILSRRSAVQILNTQMHNIKGVESQTVAIDPFRPFPEYSAEIFRLLTPEELALAKLLFDDKRIA